VWASLPKKGTNTPFRLSTSWSATIATGRSARRALGGDPTENRSETILHQPME
jgi:hypothetical protein